MTPAPSPAPSPAPRRRSIGLYVLLLALPLLVLVPLLAFSGTLLYIMARDANEGIARELAAANQALNAVVQREFTQAEDLLNLIAHSTAIASTGVNAQEVGALMERLTRTGLGIQAIMLLDREGRILAQYPPEPDAPARIALQPYQLRTFHSGEVVVSDLDPGDATRPAALTINQPVWRRGELRWIISAQISPAHLTRVMSTQVAARGAVAALLDTRPVLVARTGEAERFVGLTPSQETLEALASGPQGVRRFRTLDGNEFLWAWSALPTSQWHVMLGHPAAEVDQALRASMLRLAGVGLALLLLGVGATVLVARRIARSVDRMTTSAPGLIRGETPPYHPSGVRQLDALYQTLQDAGAVIGKALWDRDRALEAERIARTLADEDNRAKDEFIATLSHELRNPLSPIRAAAAVLKSPRIDPARHDWAVAVIERQSTAMARLLEDLLDISRISCGRIDLERQRVTLSQVIDAAVETARPLIEQRQHHLGVRLPADPVWLDADPLRLGQVFANLLTNAAKYTDPGGRIELEAAVEGREVRVRVRDSGIGLEPSALEQVFQKFAQVRGPLDRSQGGLGLGLSLVRGLVRLHGGWVRAHSEGLGKGSEFVVGLPVQSA